MYGWDFDDDFEPYWSEDESSLNIDMIEERSCSNHFRGSCPDGENCLYSHDPSLVPLCRFFTKGNCRYGNKCWFRHEKGEEKDTRSKFNVAEYNEKEKKKQQKVHEEWKKRAEKQREAELARYSAEPYSQASPPKGVTELHFTDAMDKMRQFRHLHFPLECKKSNLTWVEDRIKQELVADTSVQKTGLDFFCDLQTLEKLRYEGNLQAARKEADADVDEAMKKTDEAAEGKSQDSDVTEDEVSRDEHGVYACRIDVMKQNIKEAEQQYDIAPISLTRELQKYDGALDGRSTLKEFYSLLKEAVTKYRSIDMLDGRRMKEQRDLKIIALEEQIMTVIADPETIEESYCNGDEHFPKLVLLLEEWEIKVAEAQKEEPSQKSHKEQLFDLKTSRGIKLEDWLAERHTWMNKHKQENVGEKTSLLENGRGDALEVEEKMENKETTVGILDENENFESTKVKDRSKKHPITVFHDQILSEILSSVRNEKNSDTFCSLEEGEIAANESIDEQPSAPMNSPHNIKEVIEANILAFRFRLEDLFKEHSICKWSTQEISQFFNEARSGNFPWAEVMTLLFEAYRPTPKKWAEVFIKFMYDELDEVSKDKVDQIDEQSGLTMGDITLVELLSFWTEESVKINELYSGGVLAGLMELDLKKWDVKRVAEIAEYMAGSQPSTLNSNLNKSRAFLAVGFGKCVSFDTLCQFVNHLLRATGHDDMMADLTCKCESFDCQCPLRYEIDWEDGGTILSLISEHMDMKTEDIKHKFFAKATKLLWPAALMSQVYCEYMDPFSGKPLKDCQPIQLTEEEEKKYMKSEWAEYDLDCYARTLRSKQVGEDGDGLKKTDTNKDSLYSVSSNSETETASEDEYMINEHTAGNDVAATSKLSVCDTSVQTSDPDEKVVASAKQSSFKKQSGKKKSVSFSEDSIELHDDFSDQYNDYRDEMEEDYGERQSSKSPSKKTPSKDNSINDGTPKKSVGDSGKKLKPASEVVKSDEEKGKDREKKSNTPLGKTKAVKKEATTESQRGEHKPKMRQEYVNRSRRRSKTDEVNPKPNPEAKKDATVNTCHDVKTNAQISADLVNGTLCSTETKEASVSRNPTKTNDSDPELENQKFTQGTIIEKAKARRCQGKGFGGRPCTNCPKQDCIQGMCRRCCGISSKVHCEPHCEPRNILEALDRLVNNPTCYQDKWDDNMDYYTVVPSKHFDKQEDFRAFMAGNFPTLRRLSFGGNFGVKDEHVIQVAKTFNKHLKVLELGSSESGDGTALTHRAVEAISQHCPSLIKLKLESCTSIGDQSILNIWHGCPALKHLQVSGHDKMNGKVTKKALKPLFDNVHLAPELRFLCLNDQDVSDDVISRLKRARPRLAVIAGSTGDDFYTKFDFDRYGGDSAYGLGFGGYFK